MTMYAVLFVMCACLGAFLRPNKRGINQKNKSFREKHQQKPTLYLKNNLQSYGGSLYSLNLPDVEESHRKEHDDHMTCFTSFQCILKKIADFKLLRENRTFLMMAISNFFIWTVIFLPFIYLPKMPGQNDLDKPWYQNLVGIIGFTNIFFRIFFGWVSDKKFLRPLNWQIICLIFTIIPLFMYKEILQNYYWGPYLFAVCFAIGTGRNCFKIEKFCSSI